MEDRVSSDEVLSVGRRLAMAATYALAVILWAPFVDVIRAAIRETFPGQFRLIIGGIVAGAILVAMVAAIVRIRERRRLRYAALATSVAIGVVYARLVSTGSADVDVVEHVHFVEYGLLAVLFYRAWRSLDDGAIFILPGLAGLFVGTLDEGFQWFIPQRVGEMHDVLLNGVALVCGLLFAVGFDPPRRLTLRLTDRSRRLVAWSAAGVVLAFAVFVQAVHLGFVIRDGEIGAFLSRYSAADLILAAHDREERWRAHPPLKMGRVSREDQYLSEGMWHAQRRNRDWDAGQFSAAWRENRILEKFFAPVLTTPSYLAPAGFAWPAEQRADAAKRGAAGVEAYVSDAAPIPIYAWPKSLLWGCALFVMACLVLVGMFGARRPRVVPALLGEVT